MDHIDSRGGDLDVDLESGGTTSEEDGKYAYKLLDRPWSELAELDGSIKGRDGSGSYNKVLNSSEVLVEDEEMMSNKLGPDVVNLVDKKMEKDNKRKKTSSKIPSKPPRPPRGPSLDAADIKLVREFSELAALKRKRIERMKSLRKKKEDKPSPLNSNLFAMIVTLLFCFVIIFQGIFHDYMVATYNGVLKQVSCICFGPLQYDMLLPFISLLPVGLIVHPIDSGFPSIRNGSNQLVTKVPKLVFWVLVYDAKKRYALSANCIDTMTLTVASFKRKLEFIYVQKQALELLTF
ncbi:hypothetical protein TEA_021722 [Camellia sinensis var. sinensis]|uniref:Uncharacterized protein n=1 Tax=Camellia sinensis var. sinensis TaxID=542762 RepID=A0A4S4DZJ1_CAMSN|nr:hypothetical protein TEA_021722 [Camellia sinensis var. sinensis]